MWRRKSFLAAAAVLAVMTVDVEAASVRKIDDRVVFPDSDLSTSRGWTWRDGDLSSRPLLIGHRGASGMYPEHTRMAYEAAAEQGADFIECDIVLTQDLQLVCSHEPWISEISNVAENVDGAPDHPDYSSRRTTRVINDDDPAQNWNDKGPKYDWFTYDFTLKELQGLRRKQARDYRDPNYDWEQSFVPFSEYLQLAADLGFGIYPEVKHGFAANKILNQELKGETMESLVAKALIEAGYKEPREDCYIQSFELSTFTRLKDAGLNANFVFLLNGDNADKTTDEYLQMYKDDYGVVGIGLDKDLVRTVGADGYIENVDEELIDRVHSHDLPVIVYTFRNEPVHLSWDYGQDAYVEYERFLELGIDGYFTDFPASLHRYFETKEMEYIIENDIATGGAAKNGGLRYATILSAIALLWSRSLFQKVI